MSAPCESFEDVRSRLDDIVDILSNPDITLDEALSLYEEAVKLGLAACDLSEQDALAQAAALDETELAEVAPSEVARVEAYDRTERENSASLVEEQSIP